MDALEMIFTRRSIRKFLDKKIEPEKVNLLLKAAMTAPSARNAQPWHFLVIDDRDLLNRIPNVHPYAKMCLEAPLAIIPCVDESKLQHKDYWPLDLSNASENILLTARAIGLGGVWLGVYPDDERVAELQDLFKLNKEVIPFCILPLGYSDMEQKEVDRYKEDRVHYNQW